MLLTFASSLVFLSSASAVPSAPWDALRDDVNVWEREEMILDGDMRAEGQDEAFHMAKDLFPPVKEGAASSEAVSSAFVSSRPTVLSILVEGESVQLQDVPLDAWFAPYIQSIAERSLVSGYRDDAGRLTGFFGVGDFVTIGQLAKVLVRSADIDICSDSPNNRSAFGHWSAPYVSCAESGKWTLFMDGSLDVERPATRAEVVGTLLQALGVKPADAVETSFVDVRPSTPFADAIAQAQKNGIVSGYRDAQGNALHRFGPFDAVTRAEFAKMVVRGLEEYGD